MLDKTKYIKNGLPLNHNLGYLPALNYIIENNIDGDIFEFGCWTGTLSFLMACDLLEYKCNKRIYLFDTFNGHPVENISNIDAKWKFDLNYFKNVDINNIEETFKDIGFLNFTIVKGDIFNNLSKFKDHKIALALTDMNHYNITKFVLKFLNENLVEKGLIFEDDYNNIEGITQTFNEQPYFKLSNFQSRGTIWMRK